MSKPTNVGESSTEFFRRYLDILAEAVRVGFVDYGTDRKPHLERPTTPYERDRLAQGVKATRKYNRDMVDYANDPGSTDSKDEANQIRQDFSPYTRGTNSTKTSIDGWERQARIVPKGDKYDQAKFGAYDTSKSVSADDFAFSNDKVVVPQHTSRWDGRDPKDTTFTAAKKPIRPTRPF